MEWETIIGIEVHAELNTKSKIFCSCPTTFGASPNSQTCPTCLGLPGTLPVLNEEVVNLAITAGLALNCKINLLSKMDRKNYFYPDLPKAYQITQYDLPICSGGSVEIEVEGRKKEIRVNRIHIEEDAGKLIHGEGKEHSLVDYNRAGVPLIEIVSEADLRSPNEAVEYVKELKGILEYCGISDCRMEQGSLRFDANISVRKIGQETFNNKVEIKNMNSFKELLKALEMEEERQRSIYTSGGGVKILQETRRWDSVEGRTIPMRTKEAAGDYGFFLEADIPSIMVEEQIIEGLQQRIPELPKDKKRQFQEEYGLAVKDVEILVGDKPLGEFYEATVKKGADPKVTANWMLGELLRLLKEKEVSSDAIPIKVEDLVGLMNLLESDKISGKIAKEVFKEMFLTGKDPVKIVEDKGLSQISQGDVMEKVIRQVLMENAPSVEDYKRGKKQAFGFLMGQIMKATGGKANPQVAKEALESKLF